jgi:hypothetical protein
VPDLELYGVPRDATEAAMRELARVAAQLAVGGIGAPLS